MKFTRVYLNNGYSIFSNFLKMGGGACSIVIFFYIALFAKVENAKSHNPGNSFWGFGDETLATIPKSISKAVFIIDWR
jgi:hypothetical protein